MDNPLIPEPTLEKQLRGHKSSVTAVNFSPNEQLLASSSLDNSVLLWNLRGTIKSYRFNGHSEAVTDVQFSPTSKYMVSCSRDKTVRVWVPTVTGSVGMFKAHSQTVRSVQFTPDGTKILTASDDKIVKLWSSDKHKFLSSFVGHTNWVRCARISNDCSVIASCSDDKTVRLWSPDGGDCIHTYKIDKGHGYNLAWHPSGCYVGVCTSLGNLKLFDIRTHKIVQYYSIHSDIVTQMSFHPSGSFIITSSKDGKMKILDLLEGHPIFTLTGHNGGINTSTFSFSGNYFASGGDDKVLMIWKTNFTEVDKYPNENTEQNIDTLNKTNSQASKLNDNKKKTKQGINIWSQCYHGTNYPVSTFIHLNDISEGHSSKSVTKTEMLKLNMEELPKSANDCNNNCESYKHDSSIFSKEASFKSDFFSFNVGDISHIPRTPPTPATYVIPTIGNKNINNNEEHLFGMISLKSDDVCYTSGTIEWVGRKRSYPLNSGFKVLRDSHQPGYNLPQCAQQPYKEPASKIPKKTNINHKCDQKDCECADVLPTVNAIVDHLNALHEAVDLVDLRLNNIEDAVGSNH